MRTKNVPLIGLFVLAGVAALFLLTEHILAWRDCQAALNFPAVSQAEVIVTQYDTDRSIALNQGEKEALFDILRDQVNFAGIGSKRGDSITREDHAYSIDIFDGSYDCIFIIAENDSKNLLYGDSFFIKIQEMPEVAILLDEYFN